MFHRRLSPLVWALLLCAAPSYADISTTRSEPTLESETVQTAAVQTEAVQTPGSSTGNDTIRLDKVRVQTTQDSLEDVLSPGVVSVAYPDDVKGEHKSLPDLLDSIPGVYVRRVSGSGHYTTASIRGSAPSQVNVYIDGVPVNTSSETAADLSTIALSNVERVEVYRGVTPARFSGAPIGGAINIVTKAPQKAGGSVSVDRREYGGRQESVSFNTPLLGGKLLFGLDQERSDGDFDYDHYAVRSLNNIVYNDGQRYPHGQPGSPSKTWGSLYTPVPGVVDGCTPTPGGGAWCPSQLPTSTPAIPVPTVSNWKPN